MSWFAVWLIGLGAMDLVRALERPMPRRVAPVVGCLVVLGLGVTAGLATPAGLFALTLSLLPLLGWWWFSRSGLQGPGGSHIPALGCLVLGGGGLLAFSGYAVSSGGVLGRWLTWAQLPLVAGHPLDRVLLVGGLTLVNLATGNIIVRLVLTAVGAIRPGAAAGTQPADRLRGGRLLGPMERLVILGLGLAGQLTAASIVVAAKGLVRFPELQSRSADGSSSVAGVGIDEMTEYFLVGSFVSWLVALASLALTR